MKIAVFDVDDTIILHGNESHNYYTTSNSNFRELLESKNFNKIYLYTNGTWGHGNSIAEHLNIQDMVSFIYGRDNLRQVRDSNDSLLLVDLLENSTFRAFLNFSSKYILSKSGCKNFIFM